MQLIMSYRNFLYGLGILLVSISCANSPENTYRGNRVLNRQVKQLDSVIVSADSTSGRGNFFMQDSSIYFADAYYASIFRYRAVDGAFISRHFTLGQGPNELSAFLYAYPFKRREGKCFIVDNSLNVYSYQENDFLLRRKGVVDFGWDKVQRDNYDSPSVYNVMEMSDFGINFTYLDDSTLLIPVSLVNRYFNDINSKRYEKGHILAELNTKNMRVRKVVGRFPSIYKEKPTPFFEFFKYVLRGDTLYVNHAVDPLIYVYKYPDELLYTMGYEVPNVNRNYTIGYDVGISHFKEDCKEVGVNMELVYIKEKDLLLRTVLKSFKTRQVCLQAYSGTNLVLEANMPDFFKFLGYYNNYFYGARMLPLETVDGRMSFVFYRFRIE